MWQSLINADLEGIKQSSEALGVKEMYGLLACILTARSWDVITTGIDQGPITDDEVCWKGMRCCFHWGAIKHGTFLNHGQPEGNCTDTI